MQATRTSAEPSQIALASLPRSIQRPTWQRRKGRDDGEAGGDDAEPEHGKAELERPVGGRDPDDQDQRLGQRDVGEERDQQAIVDVVPLGRARARLLVHRRIVFSCPDPVGKVVRFANTSLSAQARKAKAAAGTLPANVCMGTSVADLTFLPQVFSWQLNWLPGRWAKRAARARCTRRMVAPYAVRTSSTNFCTSTLRRLLSLDSDCAEASTCAEAEPVSPAPRLTSVMLVATWRGAVGGLLDVAGDLLGRRALLLDRGRDGRGDLRDAADGPADLLDGGHRSRASPPACRRSACRSRRSPWRSARRAP